MGEEEQGCSRSVPTLHIVERCPKDITEWIKEKDRKQCHQIQQNCTEIDNFEYHCLPNRVLDTLFEVCAPTRVIIGKHCPFYDVQQRVIGPNYNQPCKKHRKKCPDVYSSNELYKYQECYQEVTTSLNAPKDSKEINIKGEESHPAFLVGIYLIIVCLVVVIGLFSFLVHVHQVVVKRQRQGNGICSRKTKEENGTVEEVTSMTEVKKGE
ncbi:uncharacterized protein LOC133176255 [Saccostrea echinata]|uniref:uncharacterized protein LOC133176255 n=1 Tax=Saccostrea echinata TaxID=191078 RepID=UPI002A814367|nr:uncharacterized protein LOC133176255 [Saccostrea echinata]